MRSFLIKYQPLSEQMHKWCTSYDPCHPEEPVSHDQVQCLTIHKSGCTLSEHIADPGKCASECRAEEQYPAEHDQNHCVKRLDCPRQLCKYFSCKILFSNEDHSVEEPPCYKVPACPVPETSKCRGTVTLFPPSGIYTYSRNHDPSEICHLLQNSVTLLEIYG